MKKLYLGTVFVSSIVGAADQPHSLIGSVKEQVNQLLHKRSHPDEYVFTDEQVTFFGGITEFEKMYLQPFNQDVWVRTEYNELAPEDDVILIGLPHGTPKIICQGNYRGVIFDVNAHTEIRRLPYHDLKIIKQPSCFALQWGVFNNQRLLFNPVGYKSVTLPEDTVTRIFSNETIVDQDVLLDGLCLVDGICYIVADTQDISITLTSPVTLMNASAHNNQTALVLAVNEGRKITVHIQYPLQFRSHEAAPFYVIPLGYGIVEFKIEQALQDA